MLRSKGEQRLDRNGELARAGTVDAPLLARLLDDAYFAQPPPKSTGREEYGTPYIARWRTDLDALAFADAVATLTALTVRTVSDAIRNQAPRTELVIVSGGGARNAALLDGLRAQLLGVRVTVSDEFGVDADAKEAIAFAVLGYTTLCGRAAGLPRVTGASGARVLGAIAPHQLDALLERVRLEDWGGGVRPS
jgi:anhydro-N-acetylmuramic acid kinase